MSTNKYKADGVDIATGDRFSSYCGQVCRATYGFSPHVNVVDFSKGHFRGPRGFTLRNLPEGCFQGLAADGVGTKGIVIVASGKLQTAASDVVAMTGMDITRYGGMPLVFANVFDVGSLGEFDSETYRLCVDAVRGLADIAERYNFVLLLGETAELGVCVGSENQNAKLKFNWAGFMQGVYHPEKMIVGDTLAAGQVIVALQENGFRSNGFGSARAGLRMHYGENWYSVPEAKDDIIAASVPSVQYDRFLNSVHGWGNIDGGFEPRIKMHLIVHLTGGAFESKLGADMLAPQGLTAELDSLFAPPEIMQLCADWRGLSDDECYRIWNGGQGALVVLAEDDVSKFLWEAEGWGIGAKACGRIVPKAGYNVRIASKFRGKTVIL